MSDSEFILTLILNFEFWISKTVKQEKKLLILFSNGSSYFSLNFLNIGLWILHF